MDFLWSFISTMTWRDWAALIGLIVLPLSALNAFFGLRTRYKDWQGSKSRTAFQKRTKELRKKLYEFIEYKENPIKFVLLSINYAANTALTVILGFILLGMSALTSVLDVKEISLLCLSLGLVLCLFSLVIISHLSMLSYRVNEPHVFASELIQFVKKAAKKGLTSSEADDLVITLARSKFLTQTERQKIFEGVGEHYPKLLSSVFVATQNPE